MNYSSNFESSSSVASEEAIIYDYIPFEDDPDKSDEDEDNRYSNDNIKKIKKRVMIIRIKNQKKIIKLKSIVLILII